MEYRTSLRTAKLFKIVGSSWVERVGHKHPHVPGTVSLSRQDGRCAEWLLRRWRATWKSSGLQTLASDRCARASGKWWKLPLLPKRMKTKIYRSAKRCLDFRGVDYSLKSSQIYLQQIYNPCAIIINSPVFDLLHWTQRNAKPKFLDSSKLFLIIRKICTESIIKCFVKSNQHENLARSAKTASSRHVISSCATRNLTHYLKKRPRGFIKLLNHW